MVEQPAGCLCKETGYAVDCPMIFMQNGTLLHTIESETKLKPRVYTHPVVQAQEAASERREKEPSLDGYDCVEANTDEELPELVNCFPVGEDRFAPGWNKYIAFEREQKLVPQRLFSKKEQEQAAIRLEYNREAPCKDGDVVLGQHNQVWSASPERLGYGDATAGDPRGEMKKFQPLSLNGKELGDVSIGGFQIDMTKLATTVKDLIPLPPSKLPIVFEDRRLNFYHHFFQGLEIMMGRSVLLEIVGMRTYSDSIGSDLISMLEDLCSCGYEDKDNEITVFTKTVLSTTFERELKARGENNSLILNVKSNVWGFQYIEMGMQCKETELRMWLSMNYNYFRTLWFNVFKSSGIPQFAVEGVQTRYEAREYQPDQGAYRAEQGRRYVHETQEVMEPRRRKHRSRSQYEQPAPLPAIRNGSALSSLFQRK